jgi:hypothetical protein
MSERRRPPVERDPPLLERPLAEDAEDDELVEYFVDVLDDVCVRTSVPKSAQLSHTSSSAPSTFTVFGCDVSAPHISH